MKKFFRLGLKNVLRNTRRTLLTGFIIALGIAFVFTVRGFINGLQREIVENMTKGMSGEIQISKKGYRKALPAKSLDYTFVYNEELKTKILEMPHVTAAAPRLQFAGMVNHQLSQTTTPFMAIAVDPVTEELVSPRLKTMLRADKEASFLNPVLEHSIVLSKNITGDVGDAATDDIDFNKPLSKGSMKNLKAEVSEYHQALIGPYMQEGFFIEENGTKRMATIGDELILLTMDLNGSQRSMTARLGGVMETSNPTADKTILYMILNSARDLLSAPERVTQILLSLDNTKYRFEVAESLNKILDKYDLEAYPWDEVQKFFVNVMALQNGFYGVIMVIIVMFVTVAIVITSLMTVSERTREIGTLMAIGYRRRHIMTLFLIESGMISTAGTIAGIIGGGILLILLNSFGISFTIPGTDTPVILRPYATFAFTVITAFVGFVAGIIGALYPAYTASRLSPLEAMVHI